MSPDTNRAPHPGPRMYLTAAQIKHRGWRPGQVVYGMQVEQICEEVDAPTACVSLDVRRDPESEIAALRV